MPQSVGRGADIGLWMIVVGSIGATANGLFSYFWPDNGIHGTPGVLGVLCACALMALVSLALAAGAVRSRWLRATFLVLFLPGIVAAAFCAYLLEVNSLIALMAFALLGWLIHLVRPGAPRRMAASSSGAV